MEKLVFTVFPEVQFCKVFVLRKSYFRCEVEALLADWYCLLRFARHLDAEKIKLTVLCSVSDMDVIVKYLLYMSEKNCGLKQRCDDSNQLS